MTDLAFYQNRLQKKHRRLAPWAARAGIHAYRLYERDIPEFPLIVDWYATESGPRVHLQEVDTRWRQTPEEHRQWFDFVVGATADALSIAPSQIVGKVRIRQRVRGDSTLQYAATGNRGEDLVVGEGGLRFWVNLASYVDTGLFLDHRKTRAMVGRHAQGKRFLNLFGYTGSFTVYAAAGGAVSSETVDLSNTYTEWALRNLQLNGIAPEVHRIVRADAFVWLRQAVAQQRQYDLIVLDPPTFSNSKKMLGILDVQRDHPWLIRECLALLSREGELFFSTNLHSFELDTQVATRARFKEITAHTRSEDFKDATPHRVWHIVR